VDYGNRVVKSEKVALSLFTKRLFDILIASQALVVLLPLFVIIGVAVKLTSPGSIFYRGVRAGRCNVSFRIFKFRTMVENAESIGGFSTSINDHRLTNIGRILRKYKLDELPQFINVINGDMSLVGPRPQVYYYTDKYDENEKHILSIRPGITDLASIYFSDMDKTLGEGDVNNKYEKEIEPLKNKLRLHYVRNRNFLLDVRILIETAFGIVGLKNVTKLNIEP
jgi:lipopolysaccharide/colanic/teichoic acid biosynthesis glycosyltransferase